MIKIKQNKIILLTFLLVLLVLSSFEVEAWAVDETIRTITLDHTDSTLDKPMELFSLLGGEALLPLVLLIPEEEVKDKTFNALWVSSLITHTLKITVGAKRPPGPRTCEHLTLDSDYHSFPSGHTSAAFAAATVVADHYPQYKKILFTLASLVGFSRIYRDEHWFSDIAAGALIGYYSAKYVSQSDYVNGFTLFRF